VEEALELQEIINRAAVEDKAVVCDPDEEGISGPMPVEMISPEENTNGLVRYQRHYH
jgi:hypothetical protein